MNRSNSSTELTFLHHRPYGTWHCIAVDLGASALNELGYFASAEIEIIGSEFAHPAVMRRKRGELTCRADDAVAIYDALYDRGAR